MGDDCGMRHARLTRHRHGARPSDQNDRRQAMCSTPVRGLEPPAASCLTTNLSSSRPRTTLDARPARALFQDARASPIDLLDDASSRPHMSVGGHRPTPPESRGAGMVDRMRDNAVSRTDAAVLVHLDQRPERTEHTDRVQLARPSTSRRARASAAPRCCRGASGGRRCRRRCRSGRRPGREPADGARCRRS